MPHHMPVSLTKPPDPSEPSLLSAALWYAARGWHVFPLAPNDKCPAVEDWENMATTDPDRIRAGWPQKGYTVGWARPGNKSNGRDYNIGIACGPSGLLVIDLDVPKEPDDTPPPPWASEPGIRDGADVLATLAEHAGQPFPFGTFQVKTVSGGIHLYFTQPHDLPNGQQLGNTVGDKGRGLGWKIDTRGRGGYVVAAGSVVDGTRYTTLHAIRPAPLPGWLTDALMRRSEPPAAPQTPAVPSTPTGNSEAVQAYAHAALRGELDRVLAATQGNRNHTLNHAAFNLGQLVGAGLLTGPDVTAALHVAAEHIGLCPAEALRTIASGLNSGRTQPRHPPPTTFNPHPGQHPRQTA